jgi:N-acetylneuraminate synthase
MGAMRRKVKIGDRWVGEGEPCFIVAEIGINHNGDVTIAKKLIDAAVGAGCDAVKFQKRAPDKCVPPQQRGQMRDTPWGLISYLEYRHKVEFGLPEYREIDRYCKDREIAWFASVWDTESLEFMEAFQAPCYKVPSALLVDEHLLGCVKATGRPVILSTGMSTMEEIRRAVETLGTEKTILTHCTSTYPCKPEELNLRMIQSLKRRYSCPVGYSGHEVGLQTTLAAVALGADLVERHFTLDRAMWGSDQAASVEPVGLIRLVRDIRVIERALGDGVKRVYESELPVRQKLRRVQGAPLVG